MVVSESIERSADGSVEETISQMPLWHIIRFMALGVGELGVREPLGKRWLEKAAFEDQGIAKVTVSRRIGIEPAHVEDVSCEVIRWVRARNISRIPGQKPGKRAECAIAISQLIDL